VPQAPDFLFGLVGSAEPHAAFLIESRTRGRLQSHVAGNPGPSRVLRRVGYTAFDLRTLGPNRHISLRFVVPTLRKKREGWGTRDFVAEPSLGRSDDSLLRNLCDARTWGGDSRMVRPAGLVIPASRLVWTVGRRDVLIPVHQPADPRLGFCLTRTALSTPSWPGRQAVRRSLGLFLSQLNDASG
jgi:hypothetical protein